MKKSLADSLADVQYLLDNLDTLFEGVRTDAEAQHVIKAASTPFHSVGQASHILPLLSPDERAQLLSISSLASSPTDKLARLEVWFRERGY